jgi:hypothetical protein
MSRLEIRDALKTFPFSPQAQNCTNIQNAPRLAIQLVRHSQLVANLSVLHQQFWLSYDCNLNDLQHILNISINLTSSAIFQVTLDAQTIVPQFGMPK